ncbi:hypothetical protein Rhopal_006672-T1 [Rhodotorula paludigena]|uniref:F-box domain-containing protein n=1 Tax=Rhodotorula paludigena TaxID=86838 RepID=A0AAV5GVV9_9BASI|nr:hypothetical protein Rhopal_006672-T1 [Rhodotorula paludigena]
MSNKNLVSSLSSTDSSTSATILSLPSELLDEIFRQAHRATSAPICRTLHPFQQKHLYREICVDSFDRLAEVWDALRANKRLASLVQRLTISMTDYAAAGVATRTVARDMFIWAILNLQHLSRLRLEHINPEAIEMCHQIIWHSPSHGPSRRLVLEAVAFPDDLLVFAPRQYPLIDTLGLNLSPRIHRGVDYARVFPALRRLDLQIKYPVDIQLSLKRLELGSADCAHSGSAFFDFLKSMPALEHLVFLAGATVTDELLPRILEFAAQHPKLRRLTLSHGSPERYGATWADFGFVWREEARSEVYHTLPGWLGPLWPDGCSSQGQRVALERAPPGLHIDGEVVAGLDAPPREDSWNEAYYNESRWGMFLYCRHEGDFTWLRAYLGEKKASEFVREVDVEVWKREFGSQEEEEPSLL